MSIGGVAVQASIARSWIMTTRISIEVVVP
jgi:hypothetical protein